MKIFEKKEDIVKRIFACLPDNNYLIQTRGANLHKKLIKN
jgi:hypothetical protein